MRAKLRRPARNLVCLPDELTELAGRQPRLVLARALCRFRRIELGALPADERLDYLAVQLAAWQPYAQTRSVVALDGTGALVFGWDGAALAARITPADERLEAAGIVPETLLREPVGEGAVLCPCLAGWEGQVWQAGRLLASRWWGQLPDAAAWDNFLRGAGAPPAPLPAVPPVQPAVLAAELVGRSPWLPVHSLADMRGKAGRLLQRVIALGGLLMLLVSAYEASAWWQAEAHLAALAADKARLQREAEPLLAAREEALAETAVLDAVARQVDRPPAVAVLAHLAAVLPGKASVLRELEWTNGRLRIALEVPAGASRVAFVQALESGKWLREVHELAAEPGQGEGWLNLLADAPGNPPEPAP